MWQMPTLHLYSRAEFQLRPHGRLVPKTTLQSPSQKPPGVLLSWNQKQIQLILTIPTLSNLRTPLLLPLHSMRLKVKTCKLTKKQTQANQLKLAAKFSTLLLNQRRKASQKRLRPATISHLGLKGSLWSKTEERETVLISQLRNLSRTAMEPLPKPNVTISSQEDVCKLNSESSLHKSWKKRRAFYIKESDSTLPEDTALAGTWAEATSLYALANASHLDLRIWAWDNLLSQWRFYNISPDNPNKKTPPQIIYLKLQSLHYEFLKPRESIPAEVEVQWLDSAILKPATLKGGGKKPKLDPEVSSVLRLPLPSNISSGSSHSSKANQSASPLSILGLKQSSFGPSDDRDTKHSILRLKCRKANTVNTIDKFDQVVPDDIPVTISSVVVVGSLLKARAMSRKQKPIITGKNVKVTNLLCNHANSD